MRTRNRPPIFAALFAVALLALIGCSQREAPMLAPTETGAVNFSEAISPFTLAFISRSYDSESNQTTFLYQLQNTNAPEPGPATGVLGVFTNVLVEVPACAPDPVSVSPPDGATYGTDVSGIHGVDWGVGYDENPEFYYSITFAGDIPAGLVRGQVTRGGQRYLQSLTGPCEGAFSISGIVFVDTDGDGTQASNELGVPNVSVTLHDGDNTESVKTDAEGNYLFNATTGSYTVSVDSVTADNTDFNETLYDAWNPTTPTYLPVTVGSNSAGNSFAFEPDVSTVIEAIENDVYPTNGKTYQWWRSQLYHALSCHDGDDLTFGGHPHDTWYTADELRAFIQQIEALALPTQYHFTPGHELQEAYLILNNHACSDECDEDVNTLVEDFRISIGTPQSSDDDGHHGHQEPTCDPVKVLQRELLTTEFNHVSGRGLYTNFPLQLNLISWGEGVLAGNPSLDLKIGGGIQKVIPDPLEAGGQIFRRVNGATGGGGTGG